MKCKSIVPVTKIHEVFFKRMNKISPDRLENIIQRLEQLGFLK